jgi:hypothetical protein
MLRSPLPTGRMLTSALLALALASALVACDDAAGPTTVALLPGIASFDATPERVIAGEPVTLAWEVSNVTEITLTSDDGATQVQLPGAQARMGSVEVIPRKTTAYTLTARNNPGGGASASPVSATVQVVVEEPLTAPTLALSVSPSSITEGATATLAWTVTDAETLELEANGAPVALPDPAALTGTLEVSPTSDTTWTMTATGAGGDHLRVRLHRGRPGGGQPAPRHRHLHRHPRPGTPGCTLHPRLDHHRRHRRRPHRTTR